MHFTERRRFDGKIIKSEKHVSATNHPQAPLQTFHFVGLAANLIYHTLLLLLQPPPLIFCMWFLCRTDFPIKTILLLIHYLKHVILLRLCPLDHVVSHCENYVPTPSADFSRWLTLSHVPIPVCTHTKVNLVVVRLMVLLLLLLSHKKKRSRAEKCALSYFLFSVSSLSHDALFFLLFLF